jgi:hypothetical protein
MVEEQQKQVVDMEVVPRSQRLHHYVVYHQDNHRYNLAEPDSLQLSLSHVPLFLLKG